MSCFTVGKKNRTASQISLKMPVGTAKIIAEESTGWYS